MITKISFASLLYVLMLTSCHNGECVSMEIVWPSPYSSPVWHPNGNLIGFNHTPLKAVAVQHDRSCPDVYSYSYYVDSTGFWLMNKDGSAMRRATTFKLQLPKWSPDGLWIAFCKGGNIYKMRFDGTSFDTVNIVRLTFDSAQHYYPSWNLTGDTIFYDSDHDAPVNTDFFAVWKMSANGTGVQRITKNLQDGEREPSCINDSNLVFMGFANQFEEIFTMNSSGNKVTQITYSGSDHTLREIPTYYNNHFFFMSAGIWSVNSDGSNEIELAKNSNEGFSISGDGTIAYINYNKNGLNPILDHTHGTLWLMNADGTNKRQITTNNY